MEVTLPDEIIIDKILLIRGMKVMLDNDLASLYGVETRVLKQAVRRNIKRFPDDFMFELTNEENNSIKSQNAGLRRGAHTKYPPFAFTEQGVAMLSSVLNSDIAIMINIQIIRIFVKIREMLQSNKELSGRLDEIERKLTEHDDSIITVFDYLKLLECKKQNEDEYRERPRIGFLK
jgi:hypothetical protein